jgi:hypothetical protein
MHIHFVGKILIWKKCKHFHRQHSCFQTTLLGDLVYNKYLGMKKIVMAIFSWFCIIKRNCMTFFLSGIIFALGQGAMCTRMGGTRYNPATCVMGMQSEDTNNQSCRMLTELNVQQDPHCPWFLTSVTRPWSRQSTVRGSSSRWGRNKLETFLAALDPVWWRPV